MSSSLCYSNGRRIRSSGEQRMIVKLGTSYTRFCELNSGAEQ